MLDFGINKEKLVKESQLRAAQPMQEEKTMYESALERMEQRTRALQESTFVLGGKSYEDSEQMQQVKSYQAAIAKAMTLPVPQDSSQMEASVKMIENSYRGLIQSCEQYIATHRKPRTGAGKERLRLINGTLHLARQELAMLAKTATELQKVAQEEQADYVWGNVLGSIRGAEFDLDKMQDVQTGGAGTSEVKILKTQKSGTLFFKAEETLRTYQDEFASRYLDTAQSRADARIYAELDKIIKTQGNYGPPIEIVMGEYRTRLKKASTLEELKTACHDMFTQLVSEGVEVNLQTDERTCRIIQEVIPRLASWDTRLEIANKTAKIGLGEVLSQRNVLTSRMAIMLRVPELVAHSNATTLYQGGVQQEKGIAMQQARGEMQGALDERAVAEHKQVVYTAEALRQFSCLRLFDMICGQVDRNAGNRFVTTMEKDGKIIITGVQGIDHDMSFGALRYDDLKQKQGSLPPFLDVNQKCSLAALDKGMVDTLRSLSKNDLEYCLGDMLGQDYIDAAWDRCQGIVAEIARMEQETPELLVDRSKWNTAVARRYETENQNNAGYVWVKPGTVVENPAI